jgi:uncharacterized protein YbbK (DUF523 family)
MTLLEVRVSAPYVGVAPCSGKQEIFFGKHAERPQARLRREAKAKKLCSICPQKETCLAYARQNGEIFGVWGGETEVERWNGGHMGNILPNHLNRTSGIVKRNG